MAVTAKQNNSDSFEQKLWKTADKLRKNIDAAEYKHLVLGLIFLKYISDAFDGGNAGLGENSTLAISCVRKGSMTCDRACQ